MRRLVRYMGRGAETGRRHADLARIGLGKGDKLGNGLSWKRWVHHHHVRRAGDACNRRNIADEIEVKLFV